MGDVGAPVHDGVKISRPEYRRGRNRPRSHFVQDRSRKRTCRSALYQSLPRPCSGHLGHFVRVAARDWSGAPRSTRMCGLLLCPSVQPARQDFCQTEVEDFHLAAPP